MAENQVEQKEGQSEEPEKLYIIGEKALQQVFGTLVELPYKVANPLISFLQQNLREAQTTPTPTEGDK